MLKIERDPRCTLYHTQTTYIPIVAPAASVSFGDCILAAHATPTAQLQFAPVRSRTHIPRTVRRASRTRTGKRYMRYVALPMRVSACRSLHRWRGPGARRRPRRCTRRTPPPIENGGRRRRLPTNKTPSRPHRRRPTPPVQVLASAYAPLLPLDPQCGLAAAAAAPRVWPRRRLLCRRARYKRILTPLGRPLTPIWCGPSPPYGVAPRSRRHQPRVPTCAGRAVSGEREMRWRRALAAHLGGRRETSTSPQEWA